MQLNVGRRRVLTRFATLSVFAAGCGGSNSGSTGPIASAPTSTLSATKVALHGYAIVAAKVGERLVRLPHPGLRILGVFLVFSAAGAELVIVYIDDELMERRIEEKLSEKEQITIESGRSVVFQTENGKEETVIIGANQYTK
jgi:hypothetical protein